MAVGWLRRGQGSDATLRLINDSEETICYVLIAPVTASGWGDNWLNEDETIRPGTTYSFELPVDTYHVFLGDCDGGELLEERNITLSGLHELHFTGSDLCKELNQFGTALYVDAHYPEAL